MSEEEEGGGGGGFRMMFVTLSLILLAFFILLNSMATLDTQKQRAALGSLLGSFGLLPGADGVESDKSESHSDRSLSPGSEAFNIFKKIEKEAKALMAKMPIDSNDISVSFDETTGDIKVVLSEELLFAPGTAVISPRIFPLLGKVANMAKDAEAFVKVTGHTDKVGKSKANWELSIKRGTVVARHLEAAADYPRGMLSASGASHFRPADEDEDKKGSDVNRRVEVLVRTQKGQR